MDSREKFTDAQVADFLRRSYFVVDGLWFVKTEQQHGFDEAMRMDEAVWEVMAKVQARKARSLLGIETNSLEALGKAFQLKLSAEGYDYEVATDANEVRLTVHTCPWYEVLKASERTAIAESIADRICAREFGGWTKEFGPGIELEFGGRLCVEGCACCNMIFRTK